MLTMSIIGIVLSGFGLLSVVLYSEETFGFWIGIVMFGFYLALSIMALKERE